jgi:hypothetical protein
VAPLALVATGHPPCGGSTADADCGQRCDGSDGKACKYPAGTASCGRPSCGGGAEKDVSTCDGAGTCKPASKTCAPYVCDVTACLGARTRVGAHPSYVDREGFGERHGAAPLLMQPAEGLFLGLGTGGFAEVAFQVPEPGSYSTDELTTHLGWHPPAGARARQS